MKYEDYEQISLFDEIVEEPEVKEYRDWKWKVLKFNLEVMENVESESDV